MMRKGIGTSLAAAAIIALVFISCDILDLRTNPADPGSPAYQGYETVSEPDLVKPVLPLGQSSFFMPTLTATKLKDAESFRFQVSASSTFTNIAVDSTSSTNSIVPEFTAGATAGTYYWRVMAKRAGTWGTWSNESATFVLQGFDLTSRSPANAATINQTKPTLSWGAVTNASAYRIQAALNAGFAPVLYDATDLTVRSYTLAGPLQNASQCRWRVSAKNTAGAWSAWSATVSFTVDLTRPIPSSPANASTITDATPAFDWTDVGGSTAYRFQLSTSSTFGSTLVDVDTLAASAYQTTIVLINGATYYWRVATRNADGVWSAFSAASSFMFAWNPTIGTPSPADAATITDTTPMLSWNAASEAVGYEIQISETSGELEGSDLLTLNTEEYHVAEVIPNGGTRYWRVRPKNVDGVVGAWQGPWSFTVNLPVPTLSTPAGTATITDATPAFDWDDVTGATAYHFQLSALSNFAFSLIDNNSLTSSAYQCTTVLTNGSTYYWRVAQKNGDGVWSSFSASRSFTFAWNPIITNPSPGNGGTASDTTPLLSWGAPIGAVSYDLQIADSADGLATATILVSDTYSYQVTTVLADGAIRYWQVRPKNVDGVLGAWQGPWSFTVAVPFPTLSNPANASTLTDTTPSFDWTDITGAMAYRFQLATDSGFTDIVADSASLSISTYGVITPLANLATYHWRVMARNEDGVWSAWTASRYFTVTLPVPTLVSPARWSSITDATPAFDWDDVADATAYRFQLSAASDYSSPIVDIQTLTSSAYQDSAVLVNDTTYYWRVAQKNADGVWSGYSEASFGISWNPNIAITAPVDGSTITDTTPLLSWNAATEAVGYELQIVDGYSPLGTAPVVSTDGTSYQITTALNNGYAYYWQVRPKNVDGVTGAWKGVWSFTVELAVPGLIAPDNLATIYETTPTLDWTDVTDADRYRLQLSTSDDFATPLVDDASLTESTWTAVTQLDVDGTYYWRVVQRNPDGAWSDWSEVFSFSISSPEPTWHLATESAPWSARYVHASVVFDDKIWVLGGCGADATRKNDVWFSEDGINWTCATSSAAWPVRDSFGCVVFDGKIWINGGNGPGSTYNDVWSTSDGTNWSLVASSVTNSPRYFHGSTVFDNRMWIIGGSYAPNDVWYSTDGLNWACATSSPAWVWSAGFACKSFNDSIWMLGGGGGDGIVLNDIWRSVDGVTWTKVVPSTVWDARMAMQCQVYLGKMYLFGGSYYTGAQWQAFADLWMTSDGESWQQTEGAVPWEARQHHSSVVFNGSIWLLGGSNGSGAAFNDVWRFGP